MIQKRFPTNPTMEEVTFLNNKKVDGELYAYLQSISVVSYGKTLVNKAEMPTTQAICKKLGIGDARTLKKRLGYLVEAGFVVDEGDFYFLPN